MTSDPAEVLSLVAATALGAVVGSFLNVLIHRLPPREEQRSTGTRSACPKCGAPIPASLNLPILSWLWLRGRARCCGARISARYPLVEALTAAAFWCLAAYPPSGLRPDLSTLWTTASLAFVVHGFFLANLIANSFIDFEFRILPDRLTKPLMVVGVLAAGVAPFLAPLEPLPGLATLAATPHSVLSSLIGLSTGFGVTFGVRWAARAMLGKEAMGFGDVKLMAGVGAFLGWNGALLTFFLGCLLGSVVGGARRLFVRDPYIAFGPFLAMGAVLSLFFESAMVEFLTVTWPEWQAEHRSLPVYVSGLALLAFASLVLLRRRRFRSLDEPPDPASP